MLISTPANNDDEQILMFVQYMNMMHIITQAFNLAVVSSSKVTGVEAKVAAEETAMKDFVISSDHHRLRYGEHRMINAILGTTKERTNCRPNERTHD